MPTLKKAFQSPSNLFSPSFFWLWNDKLDFEAIKRQIDDMHAQGIRALCPHPFPKAFRPGTMPSEMEPDYLTPGFMEIVAKVMDYAKSLGMHVWLYDEGGWPSGGACGKIIAQDEKRFAPRSLMLDDNGELAERRPVFHPEIAAPYPSVIEPGATELFIQLTHEAYRKAIGSHFGKTTCMTFTDEPNMEGFIEGKRLTWCSDFAEEFQKRKGYDIRPFLKAILQGRMPDGRPPRELERVRIDYFDVRADLFLERYMLPLRNWCQANGMLSGGHLDNENQPSGNTRSGYGHILRSLRAFDVPGVDVIWRQLYPGKERLEYVQEGARDAEISNFNTCFPKYASSAAHQNGGKYVLSESLAVYGNGTTPDAIKWVMDYQLVRGVNIFVISAYADKVKGERMGTPGIHFGPQHPYWEFILPLFTYLERVGSMMAQGRPDVKTAVYFDIRSIWAGGKDAQKAIRRHHRIAELLLRRGCDFDFIDDEQLAQAVITKDHHLKIGRMSYEALAIPTFKWAAPAASRKAIRFAEQGGILLDFAREFRGYEWDGRSIGSDKKILEKAPRTCVIEGSASIRVTKRIIGTKAIYFLANEAMRPVKVHITFQEKGAVQLCLPETGAFQPVASDNGSLEWSFAPAGSALFVVNGDASKSPLPCKAASLRRIRTLKSGWTLQMRRKHYVGKDSFVVEDTPGATVLPVALGDWRPVLGDEFSGSAFYRNSFRSKEAYDGWLDLGKVHLCAKVIFNGRQLPLKFFGPHRYFVHVKRGLNTLEIIVANSLLNATAPEHVQKYIREAFPPESPYAWRLRAFSHDDQSSGLFGPVVILQ